MQKPTVSLVLGGGHSIGIPLAVSAKRCMIAPTASMTIHPVRMTGVVVGAPQTYQYFNRIQEQIVDFVTANSRISRETFLHYMMATGEIATDVGSVVYGREAVQVAWWTSWAASATRWTTFTRRSSAENSRKPRRNQTQANEARPYEKMEGGSVGAAISRPCRLAILAAFRRTS